MASIRVDIDDAIHQAARLDAMRQGITFREFVIRAIVAATELEQENQP